MPHATCPAVTDAPRKFTRLARTRKDLHISLSRYLCSAECQNCWFNRHCFHSRNQISVHLRGPEPLCPPVLYTTLPTTVYNGHKFILPRSNPVMFLCISVLHLNSLLVTAAVDQVVGGLLVWGIWGVGGWQRSCHLV